jgi:hypothetical protein
LDLLKQKLYDLVRDYFGKATVIWGKVKVVSPAAPQIVLNMSGVTRHYSPITKWANGVLVLGYPSKTTLQVDLYTKGAPLQAAPGVVATYENTAVNDLTDFVNYLDSAYIDEWSERHDVSILCRQVTDLTELINGTTWDYRAMAELEIGFTQTTIGHTGTMYEEGMPFYGNGRPKYDDDGYALNETGEQTLDGNGNPILPAATITPSGGRTQALADLYTGWFDRVELNVEQKKE